MISPEDYKKVVADGYDEVYEAYGQLDRDADWPRLRWIEKIDLLLEPGAAVLDLGCGAGLPADKVMSEKYRVTGIDISPKQIELARQQVPKATFRVGDAFSMNFAAAT
jgi:ubiquinone/menaquinone biosynthesis C-methylase UbiE